VELKIPTVRTLDLISAIAIAVVVVISILSGVANAQQNDVPLNQISGTYTMCCVSPGDADLADICFARVDLEPLIELGCVETTPNATVCKDLEIATTTNIDAKIKCLAVDTSDISGDYSPNSGTVDFTKPGTPTVVSP